MSLILMSLAVHLFPSDWHASAVEELCWPQVVRVLNVHLDGPYCPGSSYAFIFSHHLCLVLETVCGTKLTQYNLLKGICPLSCSGLFVEHQVTVLARAPLWTFVLLCTACLSVLPEN